MTHPIIMVVDVVSSTRWGGVVQDGDVVVDDEYRLLAMILVPIPSDIKTNHGLATLALMR